MTQLQSLADAPGKSREYETIFILTPDTPNEGVAKVNDRIKGIEAAVKARFDRDSLQGMRVAVQGVGHVGLFLCKLLNEAGAELFIADVNNDNLDDVIVGAPETSGGGEAYVVFGKASGTAVNLSDVVSGTGGFVINGAAADDYLGVSVSGTGDINGDQ